MARFATWIRNINGATEPLLWPGLFQAGSTLAIEAGDILSHDGTTWTILDADEAMAGDVAVAFEDIVVGDLAGFYSIMVPRHGDVFEFALNTAGATVFGDELYWQAENTVTITTGSNVLGQAVSVDIYPYPQHHNLNAPGADKGVSLRSKSTVQMTFTLAASYYVALEA